MISVLSDWHEVGRATRALRRRRLPEHGLPEKNWDLAQLMAAVDPLPRDARIIDLGCGGLWGLRFLHAMGFSDLHGIDLTIGWRDRARQAARLVRDRRLPFRLRRGDLHATPWPAGCADAVVALSVIEHGVDPARFFAEARRLLKPGGILFVSTDYWPEPLDDGPRLFGLDWRVFDRDGATALVAAARAAGLEPAGSDALPLVREPVVHWEGKDYTFVAKVFRAP